MTSPERFRTLFASHSREWAVVALYGLLLVVVGLRRPDFFGARNLTDLLVNNAIILLPAIGMTLVLLAREIDISIGSQYAAAGLAAGLLAKAGVPPVLLLLLVPALGALMGAVNGGLVVGLGMPSIIVTLGAMVALRNAIRWATQGAWVQDLPETFQWLGLGQANGERLLILLALVVFVLFALGLTHLAAGRAVYLVGNDPEAARLVGLRPARVRFATFVILGALTALAAVLGAIRLQAVQPSAGMGLELAVIACVVVGGTSVLGGRGSVWGTLAGVALLGTVGTVLTYLQVDTAWERALQGLVILAAVALDAAGLGRGGGGDDD